MAVKHFCEYSYGFMLHLGCDISRKFRSSLIMTSCFHELVNCNDYEDITYDDLRVCIVIYT